MWDPAQYLKFAAPRFRPAMDLLARVTVEAPKTVYDLGCGAGNVTRLLAQRWPDARVVGVDDSAEMLAQAAKEAPGIVWQCQSVASWTPEQAADLIYSNAALHWLPDHQALFRRLMGCLTPGGVLAVQMPRNFSEPSHALIRETVAGGPWRDRLAPLVQPSPVAAPEYYYDLLAPLAAELDMWETQYQHVLEGEDPVKEWTKGTWLKQFLDALDEGDRPAFEADYAVRLRKAYPRRADGKTVFPFRRLFIVARR